MLVWHVTKLGSKYFWHHQMYVSQDPYLDLLIEEVAEIIISVCLIAEVRVATNYYHKWFPNDFQMLPSFHARFCTLFVHTVS